MDILNYKEETLVLDEGVNDPGIFKAVILAGGPGSGKTHVAKKLGLGSMGLVVVNSDLFFMQLMKRKGLSLKMPANELEAREVARLAAKGHTDRRLKSLVDKGFNSNKLLPGTGVTSMHETIKLSIVAKNLQTVGVLMLPSYSQPHLYN